METQSRLTFEKIRFRYKRLFGGRLHVEGIELLVGGAVVVHADRGGQGHVLEGVSAQAPLSRPDRDAAEHHHQTSQQTRAWKGRDACWSRGYSRSFLSVQEARKEAVTALLLASYLRVIAVLWLCTRNPANKHFPLLRK